MRGTFTPAESMRVAAEELRAHGRRAESNELAKRAVAWHRNRPADFSAVPANRLSLAQSLYVAEEWTEAGTIVSSLLRDAFARGLSMSLALHRQMDLEALRGFAPYDELMAPKG